MDAYVKFNKSDSLEKQIEKKTMQNTNPHILLLDPTDIKITLSNEYNLFLNTHSRVSAFILPQSHQFVDHTLVHGPYFE